MEPQLNTQLNTSALML